MDIEFDFNQWLTEARIATRSVDVLQRPDLIGEYQEWQRQYDRVKAAAPSISERSMGELDPVQALEVEGRKLLEQIQASRATFYIAAVSDEDEKAIEAAFPLPEAPVTFDLELPTMADHATEKQADAFLAAWEAWKVAQARFVDQHAGVLQEFQDAWNAENENRNIERICRAVTAVRVGGELHKIRLTPDQVRDMEAHLGKPQIGKILQAIAQAGEDDPEKAVPAAFLSRS